MILVGMTLMLLLASCGKPPVGVWAVLYSDPKGDPSCSNTISHNFLLGQIAETEPEEETTWSSTTETSSGQHLAFWQVLEGEGALILADGEQAWLGAENEDGGWTFSWSEVETTKSTDTHEWGYEFVESVRVEEEANITMVPEGDEFTGRRGTVTATEGSWRESDYWSQEIAEVGSSGQMPSGSYLVYPDEAGDLRALANLRDTEDCPNGECELTIDEYCKQGMDISGFRVTEEEAATYLALEDAGQ